MAIRDTQRPSFRLVQCQVSHFRLVRIDERSRFGGILVVVIVPLCPMFFELRTNIDRESNRFEQEPYCFTFKSANDANNRNDTAHRKRE